MTLDLAKLRALAEAATPGPWTEQHWKGAPDGTVWRSAPVEDEESWIANGCLRNTQFIAAANPAAVLSLLDELARIRRLAEEACDLADQYNHPADNQRGEMRRRDSDRISAIREELSK